MNQRHLVKENLVNKKGISFLPEPEVLIKAVVQQWQVCFSAGCIFNLKQGFQSGYAGFFTGKMAAVPWLLAR